MEKGFAVVECPDREPKETRPSGFLVSPLGLLENWWVPDPKVPAAMLNWKTVVLDAGTK